MIRAVALAILLAACGRDVRLGTAIDAMPDMMADSNGNPFAPGTYAMQFLDPPMQSCDGTLAGMESAFSGITRASLNLTDGTVTFATPTGTAVTVTGTPLTSAIGQASLDLAMHINNPPGLWDGEVMGTLGTGPLSTTITDADIAADTTTSAPIQAQIAFLYVTADTMGACTIGFEVAFTKQ